MMAGAILVNLSLLSERFTFALLIAVSLACGILVLCMMDEYRKERRRASLPNERPP